MKTSKSRPLQISKRSSGFDRHLANLRAVHYPLKAPQHFFYFLGPHAHVITGVLELVTMSFLAQQPFPQLYLL